VLRHTDGAEAEEIWVLDGLEIGRAVVRFPVASEGR
jgi:hypothetical protein